MSALLEPRFWLVVAVAGVATAVLARLAGRFGLLDRPRSEAERRRKVQARAVPAVGGFALLVAWLVASTGSAPAVGEVSAGLVASLVLVVALGAIDDRRSIAPLPKFLLQGLALFPLLLATSALEGGVPGLVLFLSAWAALNVANTFDNADGALGATACVGVAFVHPLALAGLLGFLPFNLDAPRGRRGATPTAYLGDAGAYFLGLTLALEPVALAALWIPALDLARLVVVRWALGSRPWVGDRRHVAHGLEARGLARPTVAFLLALAALPGCLGLFLAPRWPAAAPLGLGTGALLYLALLRWAPAPESIPASPAA